LLHSLHELISHETQYQPLRYRLIGIDGDATEPVIENLETDDKENSVDYTITSELKYALPMILVLMESTEKSSYYSRQIFESCVKVLGFCMHVEANREKLFEISGPDRLLRTCCSDLHSEIILIIEAILKQGKYTFCDDNNKESRYLSSFLSEFNTELLSKDKNTTNALARLLPLLTHGRQELVIELITHFESCFQDTVMLDFFVKMLDTLSNDDIARKLRTVLLNRGIVDGFVKTIKEVKLVKADPSLVIALKILGTLCRGPAADSIQRVVVKSSLLEILPELEKSGIEPINTLAEELMEALERGTNDVADAVGVIRARLMKRQRTLSDAKKEEVLGRLRSASQDAFRDLLSSSEDDDDNDDDDDDDGEDGGPCCVICYEGYEDQPENPLGIYVWSKVVPLSDENLTMDPRLIVTSVSSFNACHFSCHEKAVQRNSSRSEWDQAILLNSRARCNNLMPILTSNSEITESVFENLLGSHCSSLCACTTLRDAGSFRMRVSDIRMLLLRISFRESVSEESSGGSVETNLWLLLLSLHHAFFELKNDSDLRMDCTVEMEKILKDEKKKHGDDRDVLYAAVLSFLLTSFGYWTKHKKTFVSASESLASYTSESGAKRRWRGGSSNTTPSSTPVSSPMLRPVSRSASSKQAVLSFLCLIDFLQNMFKSDDEDDWEKNFLDTLRHCFCNHDKYYRRLVDFYNEKLMLPGVLDPNATGFLMDLLKST